MGCGGSSLNSSPEEKARTKKINMELEEEKKKLNNEVKLLLLGAGESGKSTIAKQMKIIHLEGFKEKERLTYKSVISNNIVSSMRTLITACQDMEIPIEAVHQAAADRLNAEENFDGELTPSIVADVKALWMDSGIKQAFSRSAEFQLNDSASYYFDNIDRIGSPDYVPSEHDVLRSRAKTTGILETDFVVEKTHFKMVDVGGQRSERKKWMHCFQDVTAVIFCVALSEYDLKLYEDETTNRMHESLRLFKEVCNNRWFADTDMILFLNKKDIFEDKVSRVPLTICFPEYGGPGDFKSTSNYIREKFVAQNENPKKHVYPHITCATDTNNIQIVFNAVRDIIMHKALDQSGLGV